MIPKDWSQVTLEQYSKLHPTLTVEGLTDLELVDNKILQISILTGVSLEDAENSPQTYIDKVRELLETPMPTKIVRRFRINKQNYEFNLDANSLKASGYIGIMDAVKDDPIKHLHRTMFNLCKPIKASYKGWKKYDFEPSEVTEKMNDFKLMPISVAYPMAVFFLNLLKHLIGDSEDYFSALMKKKSKELEEIKAALQNGVGL